MTVFAGINSQIFFSSLSKFVLSFILALLLFREESVEDVPVEFAMVIAVQYSM